jgi:hypothetical protein
MALNGKPGDHALGPSGPRNGALASRHDGFWLGLFVEHLVGAQKLKGLKTPSKSTRPPAKTNPNNYKTNGSQSKNGFVPKINEKNEKKNGEMGFWEKMGKKEKNGLMGGQRWVEWPEKGRRWDEGWLGGDGWQ